MTDTGTGSMERVISPGTDVVASMANDFKAELQRAVGTGAERLVIDLQGVETVDSIGIWVIVSAHNAMKQAGGSIAITNVTQDIYKLFTVMRLDEHFEIHSAN